MVWDFKRGRCVLKMLYDGLLFVNMMLLSPAEQHIPVALFSQTNRCRPMSSCFPTLCNSIPCVLLLLYVHFHLQLDTLFGEFLPATPMAELSTVSNNT
jgi:hypothetical protein